MHFLDVLLDQIGYLVDGSYRSLVFGIGLEEDNENQDTIRCIKSIKLFEGNTPFGAQ